jgi:hypothetical protein
MWFDENWITFTLRYFIDYKARHTTKVIISTLVLTAMKQSDGRIEFATAALEITRAEED